MPGVVRVAVGILRDRTGRVLIALRPSHKHQGDLWEFPGGKIEAGESAESALRREFIEELGVVVHRSVPLVSVPFCYPDKDVVLEVREVLAFDGEPRGNEGQMVRWVELSELSKYDFPAANAPIVKAVRLPKLVCITGQYSDIDDFKFRVERAINRGAGMILFRPFNSDCSSGEPVHVAASLCRQARLPLMVSSVAERDLWGYADGVHLRASHLMAHKERPLDKAKWLGASCHNLREVEHAITLGIDYLFLSPVLQTQSHPGLKNIGWREFTVIARQIDVPAYALGGMQCAHLPQAQLAGAKGIAGISAFWD